jgi:hypothetical protein
MMQPIGWVLCVLHVRMALWSTMSTLPMVLLMVPIRRRFFSC